MNHEGPFISDASISHTNSGYVPVELTEDQNRSSHTL